MRMQISDLGLSPGRILEIAVWKNKKEGGNEYGGNPTGFWGR